MTEMEGDDERLILRNLHIDGPGPGKVGARLLYSLARVLGRKQGAETVVVYGGRRTTGARPGHVPPPIEIEVS
jgi:hypothetical protein